MAVAIFFLVIVTELLCLIRLFLRAYERRAAARLGATRCAGLGDAEDGCDYAVAGILDPNKVPRRELTAYQQRWIAKGKIKFPMLRGTTSNLLAVLAWVGREMEADEAHPSPQAIAAQAPIIAFNVLTPSRAERAMVRMMESNTYQAGVAEMEELTMDPARPAWWSLRRYAWWRKPLRRLAEE